mmetsp:Transcript_19729/g.3232  ORF Transcript_19729/g.3232 Transcript_19729/m.3232 type:complete len:87 (-) Transcript_19729:60-320(-)
MKDRSTFERPRASKRLINSVKFRKQSKKAVYQDSDLESSSSTQPSPNFSILTLQDEKMSSIGGNSEEFLVCHEAFNTKLEEDLMEI